MDVIVTKKYVNKDSQNGSSMTYGGTAVFNTVPVTPTPSLKDTTIGSGATTNTVPKIPIQFYNTNSPSLINYSTTYGLLYGDFPTVMLLCYDDNGDLKEMEQKPIRKFGNLSTLDIIVWDLPIPMSGFIILSK